jgi:anti-sigma regulatory factor (Ser/Thr protein kinase)
VSARVVDLCWPLLLVPAADVGGVGHPVACRYALPGGGHVYVDAEHPGEQCGGKFRGQLEQRCRACLAGVDAEIFQSLPEVARAAGCPVADELVLLGSELATNAIMHSSSGEPGGTFAVRAELRHGDYAWLEVEDQGGDWTAREDQDDEHGRGLAIVAAIAGDGNWGTETGDTPHGCVVWVRLDWHQEAGA